MPGGAPTDAEYLLLAANAILTNARLQTVSGLLIATDGGAGGNYDIGLDQTDLVLANLTDLDSELAALYLPISLITTNGDLISRAAGIPSRIGIGSAGDFLRVSAGAPAWQPYAPPPPSLLDSQPTALSVSGTAALSTLYTFTIPGGTCVQGDLLLLHTGLSYINNSGAGRTLTFKLSIGGTAIWQSTNTSTSASANTRPLQLDIAIYCRQAAGNTRSIVTFVLGAAGAATVGFGAFGTAATTWQLGGDLNVDWTTSNVLLLEVQHSNNAASISIDRLGATLTHQPA